MSSLLIQLPVPQLVPQQCTGNIPLAAASLILHAQRSGVTPASIPGMLPQDFQTRAGDAALINRIVDTQPGLIGFTCTVWNSERTMYLARSIKELLPNTTIVLGGPDVAGDVWFVNDMTAPFDVAVEGEGEAALAAILSGANPRDIQGLLLPGGQRTAGAITIPPVASLDSTHDPFINGLVTHEPDGVMFVELWRGCKYRCSFCRYHQGRSGSAPAQRTTRQIEEVFAWAHGHAVREIYLLDPSLEQRPAFGTFLDHLAQINKPRIPIFCELRADFIDAATAGKLARAGVRQVETGLQTVNPQAMRLSGRGCDLKRFSQGIKTLQDAGISILTDVMVGLPGDSPQGLRETLAFVDDHDLGLSTQIFRTQSLPGTRLRSDAAKLGIDYEPMPPYYVLSTPTWSRDLMDEALRYAQDALDVDLQPEERPLLLAPGWLESVRGDIAGAGFFYGFDLDTGKGRGDADRENFAQSGNAVTLWFRTRSPFRDSAACAAAVDRLLRANPFSSVTIAVQVSAGAPLDILDSVYRALDGHAPPRYVERMYETLGAARAGSRVLLAIDAHDVIGLHDDWLLSARESAQIVWLVNVTNAAGLAEILGRIRPEIDDYVFADLPIPSVNLQREALFDDLRAAVEEPEMVLLPAPEAHWQWVEFLEPHAVVR